MGNKLFLLLAPLTGLVLLVGVAPLAAAQPQAAPQSGAAVCVDCHTDTVNAFKGTPHAESSQGCARGVTAIARRTWRPGAARAR